MELRPHDQPRRRLREHGALYLSAPELLAVVMTGLGAGDALELSYRLLARFGSLAQLAQASLVELCQVPGMGPARASQIQAALELGRRRLTDGPQTAPLVTSPGEAASLLQEHMGRAPQEEIYALLLDTKNRVLGCHLIYRGTLNATTVRPADVFREAIRQGAAALILAHSHPSGDVKPSPEDVATTKDIVRVGALLGIDVLDHLVLSHQGGGYCSLKQEGLLE